MEEIQINKNRTKISNLWLERKSRRWLGFGIEARWKENGAEEDKGTVQQNSNTNLFDIK